MKRIEKCWKERYKMPLENDCYSRIDDTLIYDQDVANFVRQHMRFRDLFSFRKIVSAVLSAHAIMLDEQQFEEHKDRKWKFSNL